jgi:hypothetical protein
LRPAEIQSCCEGGNDGREVFDYDDLTLEGMKMVGLTRWSLAACDAVPPLSHLPISRPPSTIPKFLKPWIQSCKGIFVLAQTGPFTPRSTSNTCPVEIRHKRSSFDQLDIHRMEAQLLP